MYPTHYNNKIYNRSLLPPPNDWFYKPMINYTLPLLSRYNFLRPPFNPNTYYQFHPPNHSSVEELTESRESRESRESLEFKEAKENKKQQIESSENKENSSLIKESDHPKSPVEEKESSNDLKQSKPQQVRFIFPPVYSFGSNKNRVDDSINMPPIDHFSKSSIGDPIEYHPGFISECPPSPLSLAFPSTPRRLSFLQEEEEDDDLPIFDTCIDHIQVLAGCERPSHPPPPSPPPSPSLSLHPPPPIKRRKIHKFQDSSRIASLIDEYMREENKRDRFVSVIEDLFEQNVNLIHEKMEKSKIKKSIEKESKKAQKTLIKDGSNGCPIVYGCRTIGIYTCQEHSMRRGLKLSDNLRLEYCPGEMGKTAFHIDIIFKIPRENYEIAYSHADGTSLQKRAFQDRYVQWVSMFTFTLFRRMFSSIVKYYPNSNKQDVDNKAQVVRLLNKKNNGQYKYRLKDIWDLLFCLLGVYYDDALKIAMEAGDIYKIDENVLSSC